MTQEDKQLSKQKIYTKPHLVNYGDLSVLTTSTSVGKNFDMTGGGDTMYTTGPGIGDAIEETFERFDRSSSSSDSSGRSGRRGGE